MALPSVFSYLDYRSFLRDWFEARKRADGAYSHGQFAQDGGCSRSALANVLSGARTPRAGTLDAFARAMDLPPSARNYLGLLVELSAATELDRRRAVMERILASEHHQQVRLAEREPDDDLFRYLEHWYIPVIRELATLPGFQLDAEWIAGVVRPPISIEQAQEALDRLFELDFLGTGPDGTVEVREVQFRTEPEAMQRAIGHFHLVQVPELLRHQHTRDAEQQHLVTATLTLPASLVPEVKARLGAVVQQLAVLADATPKDDGARVYQLAVQLMAVSETVR